MSAATLRLYEATAQLDVVRDWLIESGGELTPEIEALLGEAGEAFNAKAERVALFIQELLATSAAVKQERERLEKLEKSYANGAKSIKAYLQREMERAGVEKVEGTLAKIRLQNSPPSVKCVLDDVDEDVRQDRLRTAFMDGAEWVIEVPASYRLDTNIIKAYAKSGAPLPEGVTVEQSRHVRIA